MQYLMPQNKHSKETFNNPAVIKPINIILVRHGESLANAQDISQGNNDEYSDTPLSKKGKEQAIKVAERLKKEPLDLIYSSDLKRAKETAEIINTLHHVPITSDKILRYMLNDEHLEDLFLVYPRQNLLVYVRQSLLPPPRRFAKKINTEK